MTTDVDTQTFETVQAEQDTKWCSHPRKSGDRFIRCRSRDYSYCPSCAALDAASVRRIIESGFTADGTHTYWFVTLTAPSFANAKDQYARLVMWNHNVGELWKHTVKYVNKVLHDVEYARVVEFQRRGAVHIHAIVRVGDNGKTDVEKALRRMRTYKVTVDSVDYKWGRVYDVQQIDASQLEDTGDYATKTYPQSLSYVVGYNIKQLGRSIVTQLEPEQRAHCAKLSQAAVQLGMSSKCVRAYGFGGHQFSKSRGWSQLTKTAIADERRQWAEQNGSETDDAQRERIYTRELETRDRILSAHGHTGTYTPTADPAEVRDRFCGGRSGTCTPSPWFNQNELNHLRLQLDNLHQP